MTKKEQGEKYTFYVDVGVDVDVDDFLQSLLSYCQMHALQNLM